jgi:zinc transporter ZupT
MTCRSSLTPQTGVGFGAAGAGVKGATFAKARNLAIGIGIQNFPEGLAVSLPLHRAGFSKMRAFWYGQMSGMVEPVAGILGVSNVPPFTESCIVFLSTDLHEITRPSLCWYCSNDWG